MAKAPSNKLTAGDVQDLAVAVEQLTEEVRLLRTAVDELRDDAIWAARQALAVGDSLVPGHLRRQYDPLVPDSSDSETEEPTVPPPMDHAMDHADEDAESSYCCERPMLAWNGDPDVPGVACENCGYVVVENGSVIIWREYDDESADATPKQAEQRQGNLFS